MIGIPDHAIATIESMKPIPSGWGVFLGGENNDFQKGPLPTGESR